MKNQDPPKSNKKSTSGKDYPSTRGSVYVNPPGKGETRTSASKDVKNNKKSSKAEDKSKPTGSTKSSVYAAKPSVSKTDTKRTPSVYKKGAEQKKEKQLPSKKSPSPGTKPSSAAGKAVPQTAHASAPETSREAPKYKDLSKLLDALRNSELLKEYASAPPPAPEKKPAAPKKPIPAKSPEPSSGLTAAPFVLIVDDNEVQLFLMKKIVEELGYQCITTNAPETAVRIISEKLPAVVFCDVNFGIGNPTGLDVFINIRKKNIKVPFVIVSAFLQQEFIDKAKEIGIADYLLKPVERERIAAVIKKYTNR